MNEIKIAAGVNESCAEFISLVYGETFLVFIRG